tara:strand:+ start:325 stop:741 length:417 start_codon:yes stop_codon:yes gene_type:complete
MAVRLNKRHGDMVRTKIQTSQLLNRLADHAFGKIDLEANQIRSIEILLNKALPNLQAVAVANIDQPEDVTGFVIKMVHGTDDRDTSNLPSPVSTESIQDLPRGEGVSQIVELRYQSPDSSDSEASEDTVYEGSTIQHS